MKCSRLKLEGCVIISIPPFSDTRGAFETSWEFKLLTKNGITFKPDSAFHSYNIKFATLRGMHYQTGRNGQSKLVSCVAGKIYDVIVDLRTESSTYLQWAATELSAASGDSIFIPAGCAHGFLTLADETTVFYLTEGDYVPSAAGTLRWNDPVVGIEWPISDPILSERDRDAPDFSK